MYDPNNLNTLSTANFILPRHSINLMARTYKHFESINKNLLESRKGSTSPTNAYNDFANSTVKSSIQSTPYKNKPKLQLNDKNLVISPYTSKSQKSISAVQSRKLTPVGSAPNLSSRPAILSIPDCKYKRFKLAAS